MEHNQQKMQTVLQQTTEVRQMPALKEARLGRQENNRIHTLLPSPSCEMENYKVSENMS